MTIPVDMKNKARLINQSTRKNFSQGGENA